MAFAAGALLASHRGWGSALVSVSVENSTPSSIKRISLSHMSCRAIGTLTTQNLGPGKAHLFRFAICGEGGYKLEAALDDARVLTSGAYVERGYSTIEKIESTRIESSYRSY